MTPTDTGILLETEPGTSTRKALMPGEPIPLSDEARKKLANELLGYYKEAKAAAAADEARLAQDREDYASKAVIEYDNSILVDEAGQDRTPVVRIPVSRATIRAWVAQMIAALLGDPPHLYVQPGPDDEPAAADRVEGYLTWFLEVHGEFGHKLYGLLEEMALSGVGFWHIPWRIERRYTVWREGLPQPPPPEPPVSALLSPAMPGPAGLPPGMPGGMPPGMPPMAPGMPPGLPPTTMTGNPMAMGAPVQPPMPTPMPPEPMGMGDAMGGLSPSITPAGTLSPFPSEPGAPELPHVGLMGMLLTLVGKLRPKRTPKIVTKAGWKIVFDAPRLEVVRRERIHVYPTDATNLDDAAMLFYDHRLTRRDIVLARKPLTDEDGTEIAPAQYTLSDEELKTLFSDAAPAATGNDTTLKDKTPSTEEDRNPRVEVAAVDVYANYDWTGDGEELPCLFTLLPDQSLLIGATPAPLGDYRPFTAVYRAEDGGTLVRTSIPDEIRHLCFLINQFFTNAVVYGEFAMLAAQTGFYMEGSGFDPDAGWFGAMNAVRSPDAIKFLQVPPEAQNLAKAEACYQQIQKSTGISENYMGANYPVEKTATEAENVQENGNTLFDSQVEYVGFGLAEAARLLGRQFRTNGKGEMDWQKQEMDPVTGAMAPTTQTVYASDFSETLVYSAAGTSANLNARAKAQKASVYYKEMVNDPFVNADGARAWALRQMLGKGLGIDNQEQYIGAKPPAGSMLPMPAVPAPPMPMGGPSGPNGPGASGNSAGPKGG